MSYSTYMADTLSTQCGKLFIPKELDALKSRKGICGNEEVIGCWGIELCIWRRMSQTKTTVQNYLYVSS